MNQIFLLMLGALALGGIGTLLSSDSDDQPDPIPDDPVGGRDVINGDEDDEALTGTPEDEIIRGWEGDDTIVGGGGDDEIYGGLGADLVAAQDGDDRVFLGEGADVYGGLDLGADEGSDTIFGGSGDDTITTNGGTHVIWGDDDEDDEDGDDLLTATGGQVTIHGGQGDDTIAARDGASGAADVVDVLYGGDGDDLIEVGAGDFADGGEGRDEYHAVTGLDGPGRIAWEDGDSLTLSAQPGYEGPLEYELVQDGDDVRVVMGGETLVVIADMDAADVDGIAVVDDRAAAAAVAAGQALPGYVTG
ncbi:calcium-binding protein [Paracoccus luteus]|uniref:calcium-binding protein n=1 Tax=Paracoccus luteus TaxID=2508543 RepID=UPI0014307638|nr:calcium-binding protein [Paracoccus luteus]